MYAFIFIHFGIHHVKNTVKKIALKGKFSESDYLTYLGTVYYLSLLKMISFVIPHTE